MRLCLLCGIVTAGGIAAAADYPVARFTDPQRVQKLESAFPAVDKLFLSYASEEKIPGMVWGVVLDGNLVHVAATGVQDRQKKTPVTANSVFRIASMTKSFTALAILKLRDEGKLSLEDPVSKWIPEFAVMPLPTRDSAPLKVRQLLSHSAGFPEDNPWGDQQLGASEETLTAWLRAGIPFSTAPDTRYEYSNYAFGLLGRIVSKASGVPYEKYVSGQILAKLGMNSSTFEFSRVPVAERAIGYRRNPDGTYAEEAPLPHGVFGAMGGLLTNANDLGRYVTFQLSAWPPRDDPESGPVRRSSVREMNHLWTPANLFASSSGGALRASHAGYGYGLRISSDCRFAHIVGHGGGLPGFGSYMAWLPEYGLGLFAMTNLTYSGPSRAINAAWDVFAGTGGLQPRELPPSAPLTAMRSEIWDLWRQWDDSKAKRIAAGNLFLDAPIPQRRAAMDEVRRQAGTCTSAGPMIAENWLRGQFNLSCTKGTVGVFFTLAPTQPPAVQHLEFRLLASANERMGAPTGAPAGVSCKE